MMITRSVEVGSPAHLHLADRHLVVDRPGQAPGRVPLEDLGFLVIDHVQVTLSQPVLAACAAAGTVVVICGPQHLPVGCFLPYAGHSLHGKVLKAQVAASRPSCKRLWQQVIRAKIRAQAVCLCRHTGSDGGLLALAAKVRSGDPDNVEAQAAQRYWPCIFGPDFRRDRDEPGVNAALNYGYAILRAAVARAVVGSGLHPGLGIHHCNQYNAYPLADDLMEPLRPLVDDVIYKWVVAGGELDAELPRPLRHHLLLLLGEPCRLGGRKLTFPAALSGYTASVARVLSGAETQASIAVPEWVA